MDLKDHQETVDKLQEIISEKISEILTMQRDLGKSNAKLREKVLCGELFAHLHV